MQTTKSCIYFHFRNGVIWPNYRTIEHKGKKVTVQNKFEKRQSSHLSNVSGGIHTHNTAIAPTIEQNKQQSTQPTRLIRPRRIKWAATNKFTRHTITVHFYGP